MVTPDQKLSYKDTLFIKLDTIITLQKQKYDNKRASEILSLKAKIFDILYPTTDIYVNSIYAGKQNEYKSVEGTSTKIEKYNNKQISGSLSFRGIPFTKLSFSELKYQKENLERKQKTDFCHKRQYIIDKMKKRMKESFR